MSKKTFTISAEAVNNKAVIRIDGYISNWNNHAAGFKMQLDNLIASGITEGDVYINTPGGDCFQANEITNEMARFPGTLNGHLGALCASAGTYIASKLKHVKAPKNLSYMIHKPMGDMSGNADEIRATLKALDNLQKNYSDTYIEKTGLTAEKIDEMWKEDYWMNATEAKKLGFINEIEEEAEITAEDVTSIKAIGYKNIPAITATIKNENKPDIMKIKILAILASIPGITVSESTSEAEMVAHIEGLKMKALKADDLEVKLNAAIRKANEDKIEAVLNDAENKKKFAATQRGFYKLSLESNFDSAKAHIDSLPAAVQISALTNGDGKGGEKKPTEDRSTWTYADWQEKDSMGLAAKAQSDPDGFEKLFNAQYPSKD